MHKKPVPNLGPRQDAPPTYLWIDAICINQSNPEERSHQVRLIDRIYHEAQCVSIWLGKADPLTEHALSAVTQLAECPEKFALSKIVPCSKNDAQVFEAAGIKVISHLQWNALASLYLQKWFSRAWVIQETVLARQILVWCGPYEFLFVGLCNVTKAISHRHNTLGHPTSECFASRHVDFARKSFDLDVDYAIGSLRDVNTPVEYHFKVLVKLKTY